MTLGGRVFPTKTPIGQNRSSQRMAQLLMPLPSWNIVSQQGATIAAIGPFTNPFVNCR